jgi:hypothetical protein
LLKAGRTGRQRIPAKKIDSPAIEDCKWGITLPPNVCCQQTADLYSACSGSSSGCESLRSASPPCPVLPLSAPRRWRLDGGRRAVEPALPVLSSVDGASPSPFAFVDASVSHTAEQAKRQRSEAAGLAVWQSARNKAWQLASTLTQPWRLWQRRRLLWQGSCAIKHVACTSGVTAWSCWSDCQPPQTQPASMHDSALCRGPGGSQHPAHTRSQYSAHLHGCATSVVLATTERSTRRPLETRASRPAFLGTPTRRSSSRFLSTMIPPFFSAVLRHAASCAARPSSGGWRDELLRRDEGGRRTQRRTGVRCCHRECIVPEPLQQAHVFRALVPVKACTGTLERGTRLPCKQNSVWSA